jgi:hypothetical protein
MGLPKSAKVAKKLVNLRHWVTIFRKTDKFNGDNRKLHNEKDPKILSSPNIIIIKQRNRDGRSINDV